MWRIQCGTKCCGFLFLFLCCCCCCYFIHGSFLYEMNCSIFLLWRKSRGDDTGPIAWYCSDLKCCGAALNEVLTPRCWTGFTLVLWLGPLLPFLLSLPHYQKYTACNTTFTDPCRPMATSHSLWQTIRCKKCKSFCKVLKMWWPQTQNGIERILNNLSYFFFCI